MEKVVTGKKYRFKKEWNKNYNPIFYSAKKGDIIIFLGKSLGNGQFRNLTNKTTMWMSRKEIFKFLEEL